MPVLARVGIVLAVALSASPQAPKQKTCRNYALNPERSGHPSPLESDRGWGGGANTWELVDGRTAYEVWSHGLAFTGGHATSAGGGPYVEAAGPRQATIDLGEPRTFDRVVVWQHGDEHTPKHARIEAWDGKEWKILESQRRPKAEHAAGQASGDSDADVFTFKPVTASKVRYSFDNREPNIHGTANIHGWLYEIEVIGCG